MKVLIIDPVTATLKEGEWDGKDLETLYPIIRTDIVERVACGRLTLWVDEEGSMKNNPQWNIPSLYPGIIYGVGVVVHGARDVPPDLLEKFKGTVKWGLLMDPHGPTGGSA